MNRRSSHFFTKALFIFLLTLSANGVTCPGVSASDTLLLLDDPLTGSSLGRVTGGRFLPDGGWKVSSTNAMIFYDLKTYFQKVVGNYDDQF